MESLRQRVEGSPFFRVRGEGACFEMVMPRAEAVDIASGDETASAKPAIKTILLVQEERAVRTLIHNYFERQGFNLIEAEDVRQALYLAEMFEGTIDPLITGVAIPSLALKTLFITGQNDDGAERGHDSSYVRKPFTLWSLLKKVEELTLEGC